MNMTSGMLCSTKASTRMQAITFLLILCAIAVLLSVERLEWSGPGPLLQAGAARIRLSYPLITRSICALNRVLFSSISWEISAPVVILAIMVT